MIQDINQTEKQKALEVLINNSVILTEEEQNKLLEMIPTMSSEEVQALGVFLAIEQEQIDSYLEKQNEVLKDVLTKAREIDAKNTQKVTE